MQAASLQCTLLVSSFGKRADPKRVTLSPGLRQEVAMGRPGRCSGPWSHGDRDRNLAAPSTCLLNQCSPSAPLLPPCTFYFQFCSLHLAAWALLGKSS